MLTPNFRITQDHMTVTMSITAPFSNLTELDTSIDAENFIFQCTPYYLRLKLPGKIVENSKTKVLYDEQKGEFTLIYEKEVYGEFQNLESVKSLTTVEIDEIEDTQLEITETRKNLDEGIDNSEMYGFGLRGGYKFQNLTQDFGDLFKIDPFEVKFEDRKMVRLKSEQEEFNEEHYAADFMDDEEIQEIMKVKNPWYDLREKKISFTKLEIDLIDSLPKFDYNLSEKEYLYAKNSLLDILFSYCYDARTTCFEATCESHWTIRMLSASLSCFDSFLSPKEALISVYRRSLIYPLYRSFKLSETILEDLKILLSLGNKFIVKSLIEIYNIFLDSDSNSYVLNNLFIKDYIRYVLSWDDTFLKCLLYDVSQIDIEKNDLDLNLEEWEKDLLEDGLENTKSDVECLTKDLKEIVINE